MRATREPLHKVLSALVLLALWLSVATPLSSVPASAQEGDAIELAERAKALQLVLERYQALDLPEEIEGRIQVLLEVNVTQLTPEELEEFIENAKSAIESAREAIIAGRAKGIAGREQVLDKTRERVIERIRVLAERLGIPEEVVEATVARIENSTSLKELPEASREVRAKLLEHAATQALRVQERLLNATPAALQAIEHAYEMASKASEVLRRVATQLAERGASPRAVEAVLQAAERIEEAKMGIERAREVLMNATAANATAPPIEVPPHVEREVQRARVASKLLEECRRLSFKLQVLAQLANNTELEANVTRLIEELQEIRSQIDEGNHTIALLVRLEALKERAESLEELLEERKERVREEVRREIEKRMEIREEIMEAASRLATIETRLYAVESAVASAGVGAGERLQLQELLESARAQHSGCVELIESAIEALEGGNTTEARIHVETIKHRLEAIREVLEQIEEILEESRTRAEREAEIEEKSEGLLAKASELETKIRALLDATANATSFRAEVAERLLMRALGSVINARWLIERGDFSKAKALLDEAEKLVKLAEEYVEEAAEGGRSQAPESTPEGIKRGRAKGSSQKGPEVQT
uniref:Uncharacterized protein n=1 Tax=Fervidicoccus fontis TaxID=683846 RepID=A0A7J3ZJH3_9CREN